MSSTVDGLVSGLNTSQLISQLMQAESAGQTALKTRITTQQTVTKNLQSINTLVSSFSTATTNLVSPSVLTASPWTQVKGVSSSDAVSVTTAAGAASGQFTFDVTRLAKAQVSTINVAGTGSIQDGSGVSITIGGTTTPITITDDTAQGVADAINKAGIDVKAAVVATEQGSVLQLTSSKTGLAAGFTVAGITDVNGGPYGGTVINAAADAQITVGTVGAGGYTVSSSTNTFANVLPNVTITANRLQTGVTATVSPDVDSLASKVQAMVDAANALNNSIESASAITTDGTATKAAPLAGNFMVRNLSSQILSAVSGGKADYGSFKSLGIQLDRSGNLVFDKDAFIAAYQQDPAKTKAAITDGLGASFTSIAKQATTDLTNTIQSGNDAVRDLNKQVANWDVRLKLRQDTLQAQFTHLEVSLGKLKDQSSWLAGQISKL